MTYQVLSRKYRPKKLKELIGQEVFVRSFSNALKNDRIPHAFLFTGVRGVGKTTAARIVSMALNCINLQEGEPCGGCTHCKQIIDSRHMDVLEIDAASKSGVDNIRQIIDNTYYSTSQGKYKVFIIDEVHMLSNSAFNALLKTLEEPPAHVKFILATTDIQKVPITIKSRCQIFTLQKVSAKLMTRANADTPNMAAMQNTPRAQSDHCLKRLPLPSQRYGQRGG